VISLHCDPNISSISFKEQLATDGIAGCSSELVMCKKKAATMVNKNRPTSEPIARGTVPGGRDHTSGNRRNKVVTAYAIPRLNMVLFEDHLGGRCRVQRPNYRNPTSRLGYLTSSTKQIVAGSAGHIISAREERPITDTHKLRGVGRTRLTPLARNVLHSGEPCMRQPLMPEE
jgi:hypothetical protein